MKLNVLNNEVTFCWGLGCFEIAANLLNVETVEDVVFKALQGTGTMSRIAYAAIQNACEIEDKEVPFNLREFQRWLDDQDQETGAKILESFMNSKFQGKVMQERYDELVEMIQAAEAAESDLKDSKVKKLKAAKK